jgi:hypothetical protein
MQSKSCSIEEYCLLENKPEPTFYDSHKFQELWVGPMTTKRTTTENSITHSV